MTYLDKYLKYKTKYLELKNEINNLNGGIDEITDEYTLSNRGNKKGLTKVTNTDFLNSVVLYPIQVIIEDDVFLYCPELKSEILSHIKLNGKSLDEVKLNNDIEKNGIDNIQFSQMLTYTKGGDNKYYLNATMTAINKDYILGNNKKYYLKSEIIKYKYIDNEYIDNKYIKGKDNLYYLESDIKNDDKFLYNDNLKAYISKKYVKDKNDYYYLKDDFDKSLYINGKYYFKEDVNSKYNVVNNKYFLKTLFNNEKFTYDNKYNIFYLSDYLKNKDNYEQINKKYYLKADNPILINNTVYNKNKYYKLLNLNHIVMEDNKYYKVPKDWEICNGEYYQPDKEKKSLEQCKKKLKKSKK